LDEPTISFEANMKIAAIFAIVALCISTGADAATHGVHPGSTVPTAQKSKLTKNSHFQTPYERFMLPAVQKGIAMHALNHASHSADEPDATTSAPPVPNFGAFVAPPYFPAHLQNACIVSDNCGLFAAAAGDFDQDGKQDVAVVQYDGTLDILLNDGKGGFAAPVPYSNPNYLTTNAQQVMVADVNHDGYPDVLVVDSVGNDLIVYLNQKNGTFSVGQQLNFTFNYGEVNSIAIGDVNGDGKLDIVTIASNTTTVTNTFITVQTYLGNGDGTFASPTAALTNTVALAMQANVPNEKYGITLGDLNHDGKLDLAATFEEGLEQFVVDVAMGKGDGSFGPLNVSNPISEPIFGIGWFTSTSGVQIVDVNGDGNPDIASEAGGTLYVALGDGTGNFQPPVQTANLSGTEELQYADMNGDGKLDLVADTGSLEVWTGNGDGTFQLPINGSNYAIDDVEFGLVVADFNGDGNLDVAQAGGVYKQLSLFIGNGNGTLLGTPLLSSTLEKVSNPSGNIMQTVGDYKGNRLTDTLFVDTNASNPNVGIGISDGKGGFTYKTAISAANTNNLAFIEPVQADFNGDGKQDILYAGYPSGLSVVLSNGDGTFKSPQALSLPATDCPVSYAAVADLNGDGKQDIVVTYPGDASCGGSDSTPSGYFVAFGNGDGTFATPVFNPYGTMLYSVAIGDFNMDGVPDLILDDAPIYGGGNFQISFLPGNGDGTFGLGGSVLSDYMVTQVITGDYNQDGKPDLILLSNGEQSAQDSDDTAGIMLLPGNGDGTFGAVTQLAVGNVFGGVALSDVNGDGIPDLAVMLLSTYGGSTITETYDGFSILLGEGGGVFSKPVNELAPTGSTFLAEGNFFQDNAPDFILNTPSGPALYIAQGGTTFSLSPSAASLDFGQTETLTATVAPSMSGRPTPTGTVSFFDGTTLLGASPLSSGSATFATADLAVGSHSISASYGGDANFNLNSAPATAVSVATLAPAFTLTPASSTLSLQPGANGTVTLSLAANATFSGPVTLACSGTEVNTTCAVNPATITLAPGSTSTATLVVGTTSPSTTASRHSGLFFPGSTGGLALATILWTFRRRRNWIRLVSMSAVLALALGAMLLSGCGGGSSSKNQVTSASPGNFSITVTATSNGSAAQSATVAVTVQ
jgi:hypothetical protein